VHTTGRDSRWASSSAAFHGLPRPSTDLSGPTRFPHFCPDARLDYLNWAGDSILLEMMVPRMCSAVITDFHLHEHIAQIMQFPKTYNGEKCCQAAINDFTISARSQEAVNDFREKIATIFQDSPLVQREAAEEGPDAELFKFLRSMLDRLLLAELEINQMKLEAKEAKLLAVETNQMKLEAEQAKLEAKEAKLELRKKTGEAFMCLDQMIFDRDIILHPPGALPYDHCADMIWSSLPAAGSIKLPTPTSAKTLRRDESRIFRVHKADGFHTDVSGRPKHGNSAAQLGHIGPLAPGCRNHWMEGIIYSAGRKDGRLLSNEEAAMLMYGSQSTTGVKDLNSLFCDGSNFILRDNDGCFTLDPSHMIVPIMDFKSQLENNGRPVSALVLARDIASLALPGFLMGKYETLDPRIESDKEEIDMALAGLEDAVKSLLSLYCYVYCPSFSVEKKLCPELRTAIADVGKFCGLRYDEEAARDCVFMKITFSEALRRGQPYPVAADQHPCPNLGFLAHQNVNCYANHLYRMGLIPALPYDAKTPTAVLVPGCMDVEGGTRQCAVCRRFEAGHVYGEAYYTSESGDSDSSDDDGVSEVDEDKLALSGSSAASLRDTSYMDGTSVVESDGC
jgi:hypothetical protein